jgi:hypothetical protein
VRRGAPVEITSDELFRVEVEDSVLHVRRMEYEPGRGYYAVGGPELHSGKRAALAKSLG